MGNGTDDAFFEQPVTKMLDHYNARNFPDKTVRKVARSYDKNKNGYLSPKEISKIKKVSLKKTKYGDMITNYKGLERFTNLRILHCSEAETQSKKEIVLDLSKNKKLRELCLGYHDYESNVTKLKLTNCKKLTSLEITCATRLKTLDVKGCASLKGISLSNSRRMTALDVSSCRELEELRAF
ncbi:hypothetical protein D3Z38_17305 [Clostridiales bacterium]|nr:hypothetical protein [Clostridiales bacterium]